MFGSWVLFNSIFCWQTSWHSLTFDDWNTAIDDHIKVYISLSAKSLTWYILPRDYIRHQTYLIFPKAPQYHHHIIVTVPCTPRDLHPQSHYFQSHLWNDWKETGHHPHKKKSIQWHNGWVSWVQKLGIRESGQSWEPSLYLSKEKTLNMDSEEFQLILVVASSNIR